MFDVDRERQPFALYFAEQEAAEQRRIREVERNRYIAQERHVYVIAIDPAGRGTDANANLIAHRVGCGKAFNTHIFVDYIDDAKIKPSYEELAERTTRNVAKIRAKYTDAPIWIAVDRNSVGEAMLLALRHTKLDGVPLVKLPGVFVAEIGAHGGERTTINGREWNVAKTALIDAASEAVRRRDAEGKPLIQLPAPQTMPGVSRLTQEMKTYEKTFSRVARKVGAAAAPGFHDDDVSVLQMGCYVLQTVLPCTTVGRQRMRFLS